MILSLALFPLLLITDKAHASPNYYTLSEYNSALASAQSAVDSATAEVASAQSAVNASAVYHETVTVSGQGNVVVNGTFDNASAWSSIGMGDNSTILNSSIARVYNGVLIGSYVYSNYMYQTGTFPSPTRQVTFSYDMSNNNFNDGNRPQADQYRVEFRTYNAAGQRLNYYDTRDRSDTFPWTHFEATYTLSDDAVRWDIGFRMSDSGFWNGNFAGSIDNISLVTNITTVTPAYTSYDQGLVAVLQQKQSELTAAQQVVSSFPALTINPPSNLIASVENGTVTLDWDAPTSGLIPERYAVFWSIPGNAGWGIATGNVGDANALNTSITIDKQLFATSGGWDKDYTFRIRSDHDTTPFYSGWSNAVTIYLAEPYVAAPLPFNYTYRVDENGSFSINAPSGKMIETITAWYGDPNDGNYGALVTDTLTASHSGETTTVIYANNDVFGDPVPGVGKILIANVTFIDLPGPTPEEIAAQQAAEAEIAAVTAAQALAQQAEAARIQAETAALIAQQAAAAQAEANRIAAEEAAREAARIKAEAEAKAEAERIEAEIEAARIQAEIEAQEEADRIAAEVKAAEEKAEAEAKAEAERIEAERIAEEERLIAEAKAEADRIAAEEEAIAEELRQAEEDAKAEAEAIKEEAEAKELEEEKAAEEEAIAEEEELKEILEDAKDGKELTEEQKEVLVEALLEDLKPGEAVTAEAVAASGVSYADLPPETPVEVRTDENGNALVITAEVAANVELVQDPGALLEAAFTDPGAALAALGSIGADMTEEEREEATDMVVATVVAAGAAINAAAVAKGGATGGSTGGGGSSGGGSGSNSPGSRGGRRW